jgi:hypothetical protein
MSDLSQGPVVASLALSPKQWALKYLKYALFPSIALVGLVVHFGLRFAYAQPAELGKGLDLTSILLLMIAVIPALLPYVESAKFGNAEITLRETEKTVQAHTADIAELKLLVSGLLSVSEAEALKRIYDGAPPFSEETHRRGLTDALRRLRELGMIKQFFRGKVTDLAHGVYGVKQVAECFSMTEVGLKYYHKRFELMGEDGFKLEDPKESLQEPASTTPQMPNPTPAPPEIRAPAENESR